MTRYIVQTKNIDMAQLDHIQDVQNRYFFFSLAHWHKLKRHVVSSNFSISDDNLGMCTTLFDLLKELLSTVWTGDHVKCVNCSLS